jgi:hypothetical protein
MDRRPKSIVQSVILHNDQDFEGNWIPLRVDRDSWVMLQPTSAGQWGREARRHGGDNFRGAWKAQIRDFSWVQGVRGRSNLDQVLVRHAYQPHHLVLDPAVAANEPSRANYLYESQFEDWVHPTSIICPILVLHAEIGEATRNGRSHKDLLDTGTFFLKGVYFPPTSTMLYGKVEALPLPGFNNVEWPLPDMHTSEAFRTKLTADFATAMKATTSGSFARQQWFMPIHVMVDLFAIAGDNIRRTATLFIVQSPSEALLSSLMNPGWGEKFHLGQDVIKCVVNRPSIVFRYHVGRQTLYTRFQYTRFRGAANNKWDAIDHLPDVEMVSVRCVFRGSAIPTFQVGKSWPVSHLRHEIAITLGDSVPEEYNMVVLEANGRSERKVCCWNHFSGRCF